MIAEARAAALAAQQELVAADPPFAAIACPGAGKTRVIVERHLNRPVPVRTGRAITSFTRFAAAEVYHRCAANGRFDLVEHPHFIGTIDTFLWLHLARPFLLPGRNWTRLESWRDAPATTAKFVVGQRTFHLADADFTYEPDTDTWSVRPVGAARIGQLPAGWDRQALQTRAVLANAGYVTGSELRAHATANLREHGPKIGRILAAKYAELVVDEAQDCSTADLHILQRLHELGLPLILVADPDQAIYGFRGATVDTLMALVATLGQRVLIHNWRSTTVICAFAATLRADPARRTPDIAVADHHDAGHPILVYTSKDHDAVTADFLAYAAKIGIAADECLVLSHRQSTLPKSFVGAPRPPDPANGRLAWAAGILTDYPSAPARVRTRARDILHRTILRWWFADADDLTVAETLTAHNIDVGGFDRLAHRICRALPNLDQTMSTWTTAATTVLTDHPPTGAATRSRARFVCPAAQQSKTARSVARLPATAAAGRPRLSTIHQAKGDEADAVLVLVRAGADTDATINTWLPGAPPTLDTAEALRVLYVAATRARKLLGLAIPDAHSGPLTTYLEQDGIPIELR